MDCDGPISAYAGGVSIGSIMAGLSFDGTVRLTLAILTVMPLAISSGASNPMWLGHSDRVLFIGPPDLENRYSTVMVQAYVALRFPHYQVAFTHVSAYKAEEFVQSQSPTVLVLLAATEPTFCKGPSTVAQELESSYERVLTRVQATNREARVLLFPPPPCLSGLHAREQLSTLASKAKHAVVLDVDTAGTYLSSEYHARLARQIIDAWALPSELVQVEINAYAKRYTTTENTVVREFISDEWVSWSQDDRTANLPLELTALTFADLNRRYLKVVGLKHQRYRLTIDGRDYGTYPRSVLDGGLDLGKAAMPSASRASKVYYKLLERLKVWCDQQRNAANPHESTADSDLLTGTLQSAEAETHDFELQPLN
jgi:hypothetical protein